MSCRSEQVIRHSVRAGATIWEMPDDLPFDSRSLVGHFAVGAALGLGAVLLLTGNGDLFGREPGAAFRRVVGIGVLGLSAWLTVGVVR